MKLSGREKATIFLSILGSDTSSAILRYLPQDLADVIASSINNLPTPTPEALGEIFYDFKSYVALPPPMRNKIKEESLPVEIKKEEPVFEPHELDLKEKFFSANAKKIAFLLAEERPQIAAFILSAFPPMKKEEILMNITSGRDQIGDLLANLKPSYLHDKLQEDIINYFAEKI